MELNVDAEGELTEDMIDITDGTNLFEALKNFYDKFYLNYYFSNDSERWDNNHYGQDKTVRKLDIQAG